ncbi:MAG: acetylxylan esterase [Verrucomicrobia bacterium]|nr:acetylxylan esterase [Verrucomicrobiota bacterium]
MLHFRSAHGYAAIAFICALSASVCIAADEFAVLTAGTDSVPPGKQFELWLKNEFYRLVDRRTHAFEELKSAADARAWQGKRRAFFLKEIGGLPDRTPLNPRVVGTLQGKGYRVENILFESRSGFHVCANLYLPASPPPWPAVIVPCGHSHDGKAAGWYQRTCMLFARNGMAAMYYDPLGQGERYQMLDAAATHAYFEEAPHAPVPHPNVRYLCTTEHTSMGLGCILLGTNVAQYRIWDGMRAIDYLQSRSDIRPDKIGCTGSSGGGTLTAYLMALDERIVAAAPVCYLTTFRRLVDTRGAQDAEQNLFGQIAFGMDEADYVMLAAPRPVLICPATRDVTFDISGTWELYREAKRFYSRLGHANCVEIDEADTLHGMSVLQREAVAGWMHRWLLGRDKPIRELETRPDPMTDEQARALTPGDWTQQQLQCSPQGQVLLMPGERSVFQINAEIAAGLKNQRSAACSKLDGEKRRQLIRNTIGAHAVYGLLPPKVETVGRLERPGVTIYKLILTTERGLTLPALAFVPTQPKGSATLYLHGTSMSADGAPGGPIDTLVKQGHIVLSAELRGIGETQTGRDKRDYGNGLFGLDSQEVFLAYLIGKSYVGMRTEDVQSWTVFLRNFQATPRHNRLHLVAQGAAALPALHAAALNPNTYETITLRNMIRSWEDIVSTPECAQPDQVVHRALWSYTLVDLVETVGAEKVRIVEPVAVLGRTTVVKKR